MQAQQTQPQPTHHRISGEAAADGRSATDLIRELRDETTRLMRQEVQLAKIEVSEKISRLARNAIYAAIGGIIAFAGVMILLLAATAGLYVILWAVAGLSNATSGWLAPLIVGAVVAIAGYAFIQKALSTFKHESATPERTMDSMQQNKEWIKQKVSS